MAQENTGLYLERNRCDCHPETCSCLDWNVMLANGEKLTGAYDKERGQEIIDKINMHFTPR